MTSGTRTRDWADVDFYTVLGVGPGATPDEVSRAYRSLAKRLHPDAGGARHEDSERFKQVAAAYAVLSDARLRRDYDRVRAAARVPSDPWAGGRRVPDPSGPTPAFKASRPRRGLTRRGAWALLLGGVVTATSGIGVAWFTVSLRAGDADVRSSTEPVVARRFEIDGQSHVSFVTRDGRTVTAPEPRRIEPGVRGALVDIRYDPQEPTRVVADESHAARDVTLAVTALKLVVGGPGLAFVGARRLRRP